MIQSISGEDREARLTTIDAEEAKPVGGINATFDFEGDKNAIDNAKLVQIFNTHWNEADRYRLRYVDEWIQAYNQYNGYIEQKGKANWQTKINVPMASQAVEAAAARIVSAVFGDEENFDVKPYLRQQDPIIEFARGVVRWQLDLPGIRQPVETSVKDGLICGWGPCKIFVDKVSEERTTVSPNLVPLPDGTLTSKLGFTQGDVDVRKLRLESAIPTDVWLDPSGRGEYVIHRVRRKLPDIWARAKGKNAVYDPEQVQRITGGSSDTTGQYWASVIRRDIYPYSTEDNSVEVFEFWGDIRDPQKGTLLFKNVLMTIANKSFCIRRPVNNPYLHRKLPFISFTAGERPHQLYPYGMLYQGASIHDEFNRHANVILDKQKLQFPMVEADAAALKDPSQLSGSAPSMVPGKIWLKKSPDRQIFKTVEGFQPLTQWDFGILDKLQQWYQMGSGVTEWATGQSMTTNRKTKEEIEVRSQGAEAVFNSVAYHIEETALSPLFKMIYLLTLQYEDAYSDQSLSQMLGDNPQTAQLLQTIRGMTPEERWDAFYLDGEFAATSISRSIERQTNLNNRMTLSKIVGADPVMGMLIDKTQFLRSILMDLNLPSSTMVPNAMQILQAAQSAQLQQMMNPQPQQGQPGQMPGQPQGIPGQNQFNQNEAAQAQGQNAQPPEGQ